MTMKHLSALTELSRRWAALATAFDARAPRERVLLFVAVLAVLLLAADALWLSPAFADWKAARERRIVAEQSLQSVNHEIAQAGAQARERMRALQDEARALRERLRQGAGDLRDAEHRLVAARDMVPLLEQLLARHGRLEVRAMTLLPRVELGATGREATAAADHAPALYRHGVELTVEGSYSDLLAYLQALQALPQQLLWGGMQLSVDAHPRIALTLRLHTLGLDRNWLEL
jgi:MSHA biogenesis protein MshJ